MKGAIAAGHPVTVDAGARVLAEGGNAVDAAIAACFAAWTAESPLTGPGGGGFMLVHRARDRSTRLLDFFVAVPSRDAGPMDEVNVQFDEETSQLFLVGPASVAVPGTTAGLAEAHRRYGSLPWRELVAPGMEVARRGVDVMPVQRYLNEILACILQIGDEGKRIYGNPAHVKLHGLDATLEAIADDPRAVEELMHEHVSREDFADYRVIARRPVETRFHGATFASNPPPSSGGVLIAYGLNELTRGASVLDAMRAQHAARNAEFVRDLYRGGLAKRLLHDAPTMTTHISVIDAQGNAASLSTSLGSGSGVFVPGTGIHLNNMLGEHDLAGAQKPGTRLTSMMAPSICFVDGRPRLVVGSAGSARLRGAIMQVVVNVLRNGMDVRAAVDAPRVHFDGELVHAEPGADVDADVRWQDLNLFFGGVNAVDASFEAAGDPRRGGAAQVVA